MIQRIQSLYLLLGALFVSATFFLPLAQFEYADQASATMDAWKLTSTDQAASPGNAGFPYLAVACIIVFVISLLLFKNRLLQIRLVRFNFLLMAVTMSLLSVYLGNCADSKDGRIIFEAGFFVILPAILFNWMAARAIKKDEELIRSVDRIR